MIKRRCRIHSVILAKTAESLGTLCGFVASRESLKIRFPFLGNSWRALRPWRELPSF